MSVEIRELVIRAVVDSGRERSASSPRMSAESREEIISDCVEEVMRILREKSER